jgi:hypothetical protein
MMKTPAAISSGRRLARSASPNHAAPAPSATNIAVKPPTNAAVERVTVPGRLPSSSKPTPETKERYPGTSGSTQGDVKATTPAAKATTRPDGPSSITASPRIGAPESAWARRRRSFMRS